MLQLREQDVMHPGVGQEDPDVVQAGRGGLDPGDVPLLHQDYGAAGGPEHGLLFRRGVRVPADGVHVPDHYREGLPLAAVPFPHVVDAVQGAADVHPAPSLDHRAAAAVQHLCEAGYEILVESSVVGQDQAVGRSAGGAADRLVMEPPVGRVAELPAAFGAHGEPVHGGQRTVVGHPSQEGEPGPAVGACREGIPLPAASTEHLLDAAVADAAVRRDGCSRAGPGGADDGEPLPSGVCGVLLLHGGYPGQRREGRGQYLYEIVSAVGVDDDAGAVVPDGARCPAGHRGTVDRGPEAHALHRAADCDPHGRGECIGGYWIFPAQRVLLPQAQAGGRSLPMDGGFCLSTLRTPSGTSRKSARSWSEG